MSGRFSIDELKNAKEAFSTSASSFVNPVVSVDGKAIGTGKPGAVTTALREHYLKASLEAAI